MKIIVCFGTRPEAIKMAPVIHELKKRKLDFKVCVTAQHREMLDQVLEFFEIVPDYDLQLMKPNQTLNILSANILKEIEVVFEKEQPDIVLVHGDTTSAVMVSLAAFHRKIKVGHIEAGLRTFNKAAPFPEELNRQITGRIAEWHFSPTIKSSLNLLNERIFKKDICITGNTVVDSLEWAIAKMESEPQSKEILKLEKNLNSKKKLILVTGHRRENFGLGVTKICKALLEISLRKDLELIYPVHLNPNVNGPVQKYLGKQENIHLIAPVSYPTMLWLMKRSSLIISDSGGIQEEAPTFNKPVLVTREVSERMEGVDAGYSILVGTDRKKIVEEAIRIIDNGPNFLGIENPYGDGKASFRIVEFLRNRID